MINRRSGTRGFTLVEIVVTIVILAIALVSVTSIVTLGITNSANTLLETRAIALAHAYLDEILGRRFDERSATGGLGPCYDLPPPAATGKCTAVANLGPDGGETSRDRYDDVDDYNGLAEGDGFTPIKDADGVTRSNYESFTVQVAVRYAGTDAVLGLNATDAKLITVTVSYRGLSTGWQFSAYKGNY